MLPNYERLGLLSRKRMAVFFLLRVRAHLHYFQQRAVVVVANVYHETVLLRPAEHLRQQSEPS